MPSGLKPGKVAIVGSRDYPKREQVEEYVVALPPGSVVVTGGARGVDTWAEVAARARALEVEIYRPNWRVNGIYNPQAGHERNGLIVRASDRLVAFLHNNSPGTRNSIKQALAAGIPVELHFANGNVEVLNA